MKKFFAAILLYIMSMSADLAAQDIVGFWKSINEKTGQAQSVIAVYPYEGKYYGRIIGTFNDQGVMKETIYSPKERAPGVIGNPYYCGLDIIWGLENKGKKYKGEILDPEKGKVYNAELWVNDDGNLVVRGKLFIFGRSQIWRPTTSSDFPSGFKKPDLYKMVPVQPQTK